MTAAIRRGRLSDLDALLAIEHAAFSSERLSRRSFRRFLNSATSSVLVLETGASILGYAIILVHKRRIGARLYSIAVDPACGTRGAGRSLLCAAEEDALTRGAGEVRLEVREDNTRAIALYERAGYRRFDTLQNYYADCVTALRYAKQLPDRNDRL